ncbi:menaquinone biosynthesis protein [Helicobacter aurati]|uniref:Chorismate dehydratase n=1 Tax=Helicobacter aurati TaxID=137778 RepID=A0A3D8J5A5_9HELI|nr:MqnA/MqnD/SBP family protein [Helicobacter aurati]RDU72325.1 menaquinone biosynthesis protein [Helicobacter aurati]
MRFGKIEYLNLLVFDVFIKQYKMSSSPKSIFFLRKTYPSKLNKDFLFRRIDAGFISSVAGEKSHRIFKACDVGIIAHKEVWSVLAILSDSGDDYQSATSNALCKILHLNGQVMIGDRALKYYYLHKDSCSFIDMANLWYQKTHLPFTFGRMCMNAYVDFYRNLMLSFVRKLGRGKSRFKGIKIPHYIIMRSVKHIGIDKSFALAYLRNIYYTLGSKEKLGLLRFYRALRLQRIKLPQRF